MKAGRAVKDSRRAITGIVMQKRTAPLQLIFEVRQPASARPAVFVIFASDRQPDAITGRNNDRSRPEFDVELHWLSFPQWLLLVVSVIGAVWLRQFPVELAMRRTQPSLRDRSVRVDCALKYDLLEIAGEHAQHDEEIRVGR